MNHEDFARTDRVFFWRCFSSYESYTNNRDHMIWELRCQHHRYPEAMVVYLEILLILLPVTGDY